ncbi:MAG: hypothetical protein ACLU05_05935 [Anaerococcus obesiensis]
MKFKESLNWKRYPAKFKEENGIDFIGTFLSTNRHDIEKIKINVFKDGDREKEYNCKIYTFNYYVDALNFLAERDLLDIDYLDIYWNNGVGVTLEVWEESGAFLSNIFTFKEQEDELQNR